MYLRKIKRPQGIYLAIQESYYDSSSKQSRTRTIQSLGYLESLKSEHDDPIAFFTQKALEMTEQKKSEKSINIKIDSHTKMGIDTNDVRNIGYVVLKELYKRLELDKFWNWKTPIFP